MTRFGFRRRRVWIQEEAWSRFTRISLIIKVEVCLEVMSFQGSCVKMSICGRNISLYYRLRRSWMLCFIWIFCLFDALRGTESFEWWTVCPWWTIWVWAVGSLLDRLHIWFKVCIELFAWYYGLRCCHIILIGEGMLKDMRVHVEGAMKLVYFHWEEDNWYFFIFSL